jgi:membrane protein DedA with SNARE-associated domain
MSLGGVVLVGMLGSYLGAAIMYGLSRWLGRPLVLGYGRFVRITPQKLERSERFLARYERGGVFFARLLPVVRHLISIPAGILRMRFLPFSVVTAVGAGIWCLVLSLWGAHVLGDSPGIVDDPDAMYALVKAKMWWFVAAVVVLAVLFFVATRRKRAPAPAA